ncbi:hypothetical protein [Dactylosporangium sp. CA-139066]|uniref:hypothetical protein n=1 Tax=Dactylosporangium sp. CA-139066 TaxID=3239930 RepID=UPI003D9270CE
MNAEEFNRLLSRFEDASVALHTEQTRSAQDRWEVACDAIREDRSRLLRLIRDLLDSDDCWFDHHGGCQAHGYLSLEPGEQCPHAEAKALLDAEGVAR